MEGVELRLWEFANPGAGSALLEQYRQERDGRFTAGQVQEALERSRMVPPMTIRPRLPELRASRGARPGEKTMEAREGL